MAASAQEAAEHGTERWAAIRLELAIRAAIEARRQLRIQAQRDQRPMQAAE